MRALITWTTTLRVREFITKEDVLQALSVHNDIIKGVHNLATSVPFFPSRITFCDMLKENLSSRTNPILFLSGLPGSGKTNIVSYLANQPDTCITLRFHAFKPLNPQDLSLTADKGICSTHDFWSNLFIELSLIFAKHKKLSEYNIPPIGTVYF